MYLILPLTPGSSPTINLFERTADNDPPDTTPVNGSPIAGSPVTNRTGHYQFDITSIPDGDYVVVSADPIGTWYIRKDGVELLVNEYWSTFEQVRVTISPQAFAYMASGITGRNRLLFYNNAAVTITVTRTDGENFDGDPMTFVVEDVNLVEMIVVTGLTSLTNTVDIPLPAIAFDPTPGKKWALRKTSSGEVILTGPATMEYAPFDNP